MDAIGVTFPSLFKKASGVSAYVRYWDLPVRIQKYPDSCRDLGRRPYNPQALRSTLTDTTLVNLVLWALQHSMHLPWSDRLDCGSPVWPQTFRVYTLCCWWSSWVFISKYFVSWYMSWPRWAHQQYTKDLDSPKCDRALIGIYIYCGIWLCSSCGLFVPRDPLR